ncbi:hypothetical protein O9929_17455 [Vibrio lentus]|nr:hypothetical protein [Vibrio lentus]
MVETSPTHRDSDSPRRFDGITNVTYYYDLELDQNGSTNRWRMVPESTSPDFFMDTHSAVAEVLPWPRSVGYYTARSSILRRQRSQSIAQCSTLTSVINAV